MALGVSTMELPAGPSGSLQVVDDDLQSIATEERIQVIEGHPQAFLELVTSEESLPPSRPSSSLQVSSPQLDLPSSQSLPTISSHLLQSSTPLPQESVVQSGSLSAISMSCQNLSARASQPSTSSVEDDSAPKRKKPRKELGEPHQLISAATEALGRIQAANQNSNEFSGIGQAIIELLQKMDPDQAIEAQRLIFDALYKGQRGTLSGNSHII